MRISYCSSDVCSSDLKLEEFGAFTCGHCAKFTQDSHEELKRDFIDTGRVSYKLTPFMLHPVDAIAGAIVKCAGPERFFPLADATFIEHEAFIEIGRASCRESVCQYV